ncbi:MazG-like pyrophosphatase [Salmonella phage Se-J]|uniref:MazG-like pyrophosphatase n=1 Tax=Salmonella phage Se-J TaxID=2698910 RepID=UPI0018AF9E70|nr:MazG-like pyrophosphatase [Salmonella phage Se-J]
MKFLHIIVGTSYDCTAHCPDRSPVFVHSKLVEELCELSDVYHGLAASEPLNGEIADVIISAIDLLYVVEFNPHHVNGCMNKEEMIDSVIFRLAELGATESKDVESHWFHVGDLEPEKHLALATHYLGRTTRLLNQPYRSEDDLAYLVDRIITFTAKMACAVGIVNSVSQSDTRVKVEHAIEHKVEKWRTKFGL